jgi:hypothetical protein
MTWMFLQQWPQETERSDHNESNRKKRHSDTEELAQPGDQCKESCDEAEPAHPDDAEEASRVQSEQYDARSHQPSAMWNMSLWHEPDGTDRNQKHSPAKILEAPFQDHFLTACIN